MLAAVCFLLLAAVCGCQKAPRVTETPGGPTPTPAGHRPSPTQVLLDLTLAQGDVTVGPQPLRAGYPFTVTVLLHNNAPQPAAGVPLMVLLEPLQERLGYLSFLSIVTATLPATGSLSIDVPVTTTLMGGTYELWVQLNRLPPAWQAEHPTRPEADLEDNLVVHDLEVQPFDAYESDLCSGRVDLATSPTDVLPDGTGGRVWVRVHNLGNRAAFHVPVAVLGQGRGGVAYTGAIPPCGGTAEVWIELDGPLGDGELLTVLLNPPEWAEEAAEEDLENNRVTISAGLGPGQVIGPGSGLEEFDFSLGADGVESPEPWILLVTVRNLGSRDAANVPIRVQNQAGRKISDVIPFVQGSGLGVAAIRVGYLWTRGGTLTLTINPADAKGAYPEADRTNNTVSFTLP